MALRKYTTEEAQVFMICILSKQCNQEQLIFNLCALADWGNLVDDGDWEKVEINGAKVWLEKSQEIINTGRYDLWAEYFKEELLKNEKYQKVADLRL